MKRYLAIKNIGQLVTMTNLGEGGLGAIKDAYCLIKQGRVEWIGSEKDGPQVEDYQVQTIDAAGGTVMPGLVDCHTHLVHGGSREMEAAERARGVPYEEIARRGGGILSTVTATREESFETLFASAVKRADAALRKGTTTIEVKSGYGLDVETEIKQLKVVKALEERHPITFKATFLGAHAIPLEYRPDRGGYIDLLVDAAIPEVAKGGLAEFCDVFVEKIAFSVDEARRIFEAAARHGLKAKIHADQLSHTGGAELAASVGAVSADHLEYIGDAGIKALRDAATVAVMLPGSTFYLGQRGFAPARRLIDAGLTVAISTDYNPGTTPSLDLFLMATIATSNMNLTMEEALRGITVNAARALGLRDGQGEIKVGGVADVIVLDVPNAYFPIYNYGINLIKYVVKDGKVVVER